MHNMQRLLEIMQRLRDPEHGCPWDLAQTMSSIVPHTIEEAYEVAEAIEQNDIQAIQDELGDLLFQVVFYAQLGQELGVFDFDAIAGSIAEKLIRRHPHVFAGHEYASETEQHLHWEQLKAEERARKTVPTAEASVLDGITTTLPAMSHACKLQKRAAQVGFDWPAWRGVLDKVREELVELEACWEKDAKHRTEELGDLLFSCVNLARHAGDDPETVLRQANRKFERRFRRMEQDLAKEGEAIREASLERLEQSWQRIKSFD